MAKNRVLIVEDEGIVALDIAKTVQEMELELKGIAWGYEEALQLLDRHAIDIVICDIALKGLKNGIDLVNEIKRKYDVIVIYLSAYTDEATIQQAVSTNPCSYLVKPFKREELMAAIKLAIHKKMLNPRRALECCVALGGEYTFCMREQALYHGEEMISLSRNESLLLNLLAESPHSVVPFTHIEQTVWPDRIVTDSARRTLVHRLNAKFANPQVITVAGVGCYLAAFPPLKPSQP